MAIERYRYTKVIRDGVPIYTEIYERAETDLDNSQVIATTYRTQTVIIPAAKVAELTAAKADLQVQAQALQARINDINNLGLKA